MGLCVCKCLYLCVVYTVEEGEGGGGDVVGVVCVCSCGWLCVVVVGSVCVWICVCLWLVVCDCV